MRRRVSRHAGGWISVPRLPWIPENEERFTAGTARIVIRALAPKVTLEEAKSGSR